MIQVLTYDVEQTQANTGLEFSHEVFPQNSQHCLYFSLRTLNCVLPMCKSVLFFWLSAFETSVDHINQTYVSVRVRGANRKADSDHYIV